MPLSLCHITSKRAALFHEGLSSPMIRAFKDTIFICSEEDKMKHKRNLVLFIASSLHQLVELHYEVKR